MAMILFIFIIILALIILGIVSRPLKPISHWQHSFPNLQFSAMELHEQIRSAVKRRKIPDVSFSQVTYSQGGIFSSGREYLRISWQDYHFDVCAAPFGTGFFVSWWLAEREPSLIAKIPILNTLLGKNPKYKTYYQADIEAMVRGGVHSCIMEALDEVTSAQGVRGPSDVERLLEQKGIEPAV